MAKEILGVLCSGRGTNLQSILAAVDSGQIPAPVGVVLTDKPDAKALEQSKTDIVETTKAREVRIVPEAKLEEQVVAIKLVHAKLGPTFKGQAKAIVSAVAAMPLEEVAKQLASGAVEVPVDGEKVSVGAEFFEAEKRLMLDGKAVETVQIGTILALIEQ